jgi:hypothetical protein
MIKQLSAGIVLTTMAFFVGCNPEIIKRNAPADVMYEFIPAGTTRLTGGVLADRYNKNIENLYLKIDAGTLQQVFLETHESWYAEPEFVGHYFAAGLIHLQPVWHVHQIHPDQVAG